VYAQTAPIIKTKTEMYFNDSWSGNVNGRSLQIRANYTMERIDTLSLLGISLFTQIKASGWVDVNGERISFRFNTTEYPTYKIYSVFNKRASSALFETLSSPVYETWDGITFITTASTPLHVEYNHVDNGPYNPPTYNIPPNEASPTTLKGTSKYHLHIPVWMINDIKNGGTLTSLAGAIGAFLALLLGVPELLSKIVALFLGIVAGVLAILGLAITAFAESVLRTELNDGWTWVWGMGSWWILVWWWQSLGRWRDWGWLFTTILPGGGRPPIAGGAVYRLC
jgi:type IV secretory pathway VirB2 component (pilin)